MCVLFILVRWYAEFDRGFTLDNAKREEIEARAKAEELSPTPRGYTDVQEMEGPKRDTTNHVSRDSMAQSAFISWRMATRIYQHTVRADVVLALCFFVSSYGSIVCAGLSTTDETDEWNGFSFARTDLPPPPPCPTCSSCMGR